MSKNAVVIFLLILNISISAQNFSRQVNIEIESLAKQLIASRDDNVTNSLADKILELDSLNSQAIWFKGLAQQYLNGNKEGLIWIDKFLKLRPNSKQYHYRAQINIQANKKAEAIEDIKKALSLSSHDPDVYRSAAEVFRLSKLYKESSLYFDSATTYSYGSYKVYQSYIMTTIAQNDLTKAEKLCNDVIDKIEGEVLMPRMRYVVMYILKANICFMEKKFIDGAEAASEAILLEPNVAENYKLRAKCYLGAGKMDLACADYYEMIKLDPTKKTDDKINCEGESKYKHSKDWINKLNAYDNYLKGYKMKMEGGNSVNDALKLFTKSIDILDNNYLALANRASCYVILGDYKKALTDINKVLQIKTENFQSYNTRMYLKIQLKDYKGALSDINKAIELKPNNPGYFIDRGHLQTILGDSILAMKDFEKAITLDINNRYAYNLLGIMEMDVKNDYKSAAKNLKAAIDKQLDDPFALKSAEFYYSYSCVLDKLGEYEEALKNIEIAIACDPKSPDFYLKCGEINARAKNLKRACEEWNTALKLGSKKAEELLLYNCKD
jgi:tetratricopeptide (TPR) repeat protein